MISLLKITVWLLLVKVGVKADIHADLSIDRTEIVVYVGEWIKFSCTENAGDLSSCVTLPSVDIIKIKNGVTTKIVVDDNLTEEFETLDRFQLEKSKGITCNEVIYTLQIYYTTVMDTGTYRCMIPTVGSMVSTEAIVKERPSYPVFIEVDAREKVVHVGDAVVISFTEMARANSCVKLPSIEIMYDWTEISVDDQLTNNYQESGRFSMSKSAGPTCNQLIYNLTINPVISDDAGDYRGKVPATRDLTKITLVVLEPTTTPPTTTTERPSYPVFIEVDAQKKVVNVGDAVVISFTELALADSCVKLPSILIVTDNWEDISVDDQLANNYQETGRFSMSKSAGKTCNELIYNLTINPVISDDAGIYWGSVPATSDLTRIELVVLD